MRDAAHHVDPLVERALQVLRRLGIAPVAVLREGDELQVDPVLHRLAHFQKGLYGQEPVVADVDRKSVVEGKSVSVRVDLGGRRILKKIHTKDSTEQYKADIIHTYSIQI